MNKERPNYGNWVHKSAFYLLLLTTVLTLGASFIEVFPFTLKITLRIIAGVVFLFFLYLVYVYYELSDWGGNLQMRTYDYVLEKLPWNGNGICLDIGTGNAPLAIKIAKKFPKANIIASDYWDKTKFDYKQEAAAKNAEIEGVSNRIIFKHASAAKLPFKDGELDAVVSNYVFHEVKAFKPGEKYKSFIEAIRILKPGGVFSIHDVFKNQWFYGDLKMLTHTLKDHVSELHWEDSVKRIGIPFLLRNWIVQGKAGLFYGRK